MKKKIKLLEKKGFGNIFNFTKDLSEIILPLIISHFIKSYLINEKNLEDFQNYLLSIFPKEIIKYVYPQREKKLKFLYKFLQNFMQNYTQKKYMDFIKE